MDCFFLVAIVKNAAVNMDVTAATLLLLLSDIYFVSKLFTAVTKDTFQG